jgi:hypothetical protein
VTSALATGVSLMAFRAGCRMQGLGMAIAAGGASMIDTTPALVSNPWMRTVVCCRPVIRSVTARTIQAKHTRVENRVIMAA